MEKKFRVSRQKKKIMRSFHMGFVYSNDNNRSKKQWESQLNTYQFFRALNFPLQILSKRANALKKRSIKSHNW